MFVCFAQLCARWTICSSKYSIRQFTTVRHIHSGEINSLGIPLRPTWSVNELLSSYPTPTITDETLDELHKLAALKAPQAGSVERENLRKELEGLVKLVEAVKLVNTENVEVEEVWHNVEDLEDVPDAFPEGRELLKHAQNVKDGYYVAGRNIQRG